MKKNLISAAFAIAALPSMAQVKYDISGTLADNGKLIYLIDELSEKKIDSTVVANGKFSFAGTADKDALMAVRARSSSWTTEFFNDGTPVIINLNDSTLKGSQQNERLTKINYEMALKFQYGKGRRWSKVRSSASLDHLATRLDRISISRLEKTAS